MKSFARSSRPATATGARRAVLKERINLEFVSANPTGPLLISHGRGAIFGDAVARLLEATGNRVAREYYVNDFGNQVRLFATSVKALAEGKDVPSGGRIQGGLRRRAGKPPQEDERGRVRR